MLLAFGLGTPAAAVTPTDPLIGKNGDIFEAAGDGIRHRQSGVLCPRRIMKLPLTRLMVYPTATVRGSDVSCGYGNYPRGAVTLYMVKPSDYPRPMTYAAYADAARQEVMLSHPAIADATPPQTPGPVTVAGLKRTPSVSAWTYADHGQNLYSLLYLSDAAPWVIMVRATAPIGQETEISAAGSEAWAIGARSVGQ